MRKTVILFILLSLPTLAQVGYHITVEKLLPKGQKAFIAKTSNIDLKPGNKVYIPFSRTKYCKAEVQKVTGRLILVDSSQCKYLDEVKVGQRILAKRKIKRKAKKRQKFEKIVAHGPIFYESGDLGSSTAIVTIPDKTKTAVGAKYIAESVFGDDCTLTLIELKSDSAVVDTAECPFERDLYLGQKFIPAI